LPMNTDMGKVSINVVNPLVASSTVATTLDVLVYYNAGEDFELQGLCNLPSNMLPQADHPASKGFEMIGGAPAGELTVEPAKATIGEFFTSVKQLVNCLRPSQFVAPWAANIPYSGVSSAQFNPYIHGSTRYDPAMPSSGRVILPSLNSDLLAQIAVGFAFERGGLVFWDPGQQNIAALVSACLVTNNGTLGVRSFTSTPTATQSPLRITSNGASVSGTTNLATNTAPTIWRSAHVNSSYDFLVPHYGPTHMRIVRTATSNADTVLGDIDMPPYDAYLTTTTQSQIIGRGAADDYTLHFFLGFPGWQL